MNLKITLIIAVLFIGSYTQAQTKVGTVNSDYIISKMPQLATVNERITKYVAKLDSTFQLKVKDYDAKIAAYNKVVKTLPEATKKTRYAELAALDQDLKKYRQNGTKMIQLKRDDYMRPLYKRVSEVIAAVAKEQKYTQILTTSGNEIAFFDENFDITKLVLAKLGIKE